MEYASTLSVPLYYKPHHYEDSAEVRWLHGRNCRVVQDPRPVEQIFRERPMRYVVSNFSSALLTLKHLYGERVECIAWLPEYQKRLWRRAEKRLQRIKAYALDLGVTWQSLDRAGSFETEHLTTANQKAYEGL
jgi:hypothetical protein